VKDYSTKLELRIDWSDIDLFGHAAANEPAYVIAEKQLYSSHYFQTAPDLTFCISDISDPKQHGFYLVKAMGSEQEGLTGFKGSIVRKIAVDRSASSLQKSLTVIKNALEQNQLAFGSVQLQMFGAGSGVVSGCSHPQGGMETSEKYIRPTASFPVLSIAFIDSTASAYSSGFISFRI
jgi:hypothetical protein